VCLAASRDVINVSFRGDSTFLVNNQKPTILAFVLPSYQRVLQDEILERGDTFAEIFCAKNETESFQIIVSNNSNTSLSLIDIKMGNWQSSEGNSSNLPVMTLYREHYVKVVQPSCNLKSKPGMYPDALIPFIDPYTNKPINTAKYLANHASVEPKKTQGYWVDVTVGPDVPAGTYKCSFLVTSADTPIAEIPVTLQVWDFALPAKHALMAWFCSLRDLSHIYGLVADSSEYDILLHRYHMCLYQHGIYPHAHDRKQPLINWQTGDVTFTKEYVARLRAFVNEFGTGMLVIPQLTTKDPQALKKYLMAYDAFSRANPWAGQYFFYIDEPSTLEQYNFVKECGDITHMYAPSVKLLVTIDNPPKAAWWPNIDDTIDIKVLLFRMATASNIQKYQNPKKDLWAYTALTSLGPPNWELDGSLMDYRIPAWCSYTLGMKGILYWQTTVWAGVTEKKQPYIDTWTSPITWRTKDGNVWNGEGALIYSGVPAGIRGPISSMRLKVFRDSVEDFDYLKLLESLTNRDQTVAETSSIAKDFLTYDKNPQSYIIKRKLIAEMILTQVGKK